MTDSVTTRYTPPQRPDAGLFVRHTSQADYRTGDLKLGRTAVLRDLGRYLQVSFDNLVKCVGTMPSPQDLHQMRTELHRRHLLDDAGQQWREFSSTPAKSRMREDATFVHLGHIISGILAEVLNSGVTYLANPNGTPLSGRNNTSRPDGYLVVRNENLSTTIHWFDVAVPFELKNAMSVDTARDDEGKMIWSLHNIMREDPCRRFAFGISIEDTKLRLWLSNRALLAVSEPIDFLKDIDSFISLFYALGSASATDTKEGLGWDPTVERIFDGEKYRYKFTVGNEVFTTTRELATYGADSMVGRGTRVYEATDAEGKRVAIKDSWREADRRSEGDILNEILASCRKELPPDQAADAEKRFIRIRFCQSVEISGVTDETLSPMAGEEGSIAWKWIPTDFVPALSRTRHLSSTGDVPDSGQLSASLPAQPGIVRRKNNDIPRRVHVRTVFWDVGVAVKDMTVLSDSLSCLHDGLKALYYVHKAGWVYRDFSVGNVIWVDDDDVSIGKLNDFEYAKKVDSESAVDHDVRTGTMHFMALEVAAQEYLFYPEENPLLNDPNFVGTPFRMNLLHDVESVWWTFAWVLFYHTNDDRGYDDLEAQELGFREAFPGMVGQSSRDRFFIRRLTRRTAYNTLSEACKAVCNELEKFVTSLLKSYQKAEEPYPIVRVDDAILEHIHGEALSCLDSARNKASGIKLNPVRELLRNKKRVRPEGEGSPILSPSGRKRARQG